MKYTEKYGLIIIIAFGVSMFIEPAICMFIMGSLLLLIGIESVLLLRKIQRKGIACIGKIIEYQSDDEGYKTPVVEFSPLSGGCIKEKPQFYASSDLSKFRSYKSMIDQPVPVLYDPDDPKKFILSDEKEMNLLLLIFLFMVSTVFIMVSIGVFLGYIKLG